MKHVPAKALESALGAGKPCLEERQATIELFKWLAANPMPAAAYQLFCDTIARLLENGTCSEARDLEWIAERLGIHRNTAGKAYKHLAKAELCKRKGVPDRGAPTRTELAGPALRLVTVINASRRIALKTTCGESADTAARGSVAPGLGLARTDSTESPPLVGAGSAAPITPPDSPESAHPAMTGSPQRRKSADSLHPANSQNTFHSNPPLPGSIPISPDNSSEGLDVAEKIPSNYSSCPSSTFAAEVHAAVSRKIPRETMYFALQGILTERGIDAAWGLTDQEHECLLSYTRKKEAPVQMKKPTVTVVPTSAHPALAKRVWDSYPRLVKLTDDKRAGPLLDEIAYSVTRGMLAGGVPAALSLVEKGRWSTPRGFTADWRGAVLRSL